MKPYLESPVHPVLYRELALRRIKELVAPCARVGRWVGYFLRVPFHGAELVRHVAPDRPPQPRHEWERRDSRRPSVY